MLALYQETFSDWKLIGDLTEEQVSLKANVDGKGKIICRKADRTVLQEGEWETFLEGVNEFTDDNFDALDSHREALLPREKL